MIHKMVATSQILSIPKVWMISIHWTKPMAPASTRWTTHTSSPWPEMQGWWVGPWCDIPWAWTVRSSLAMHGRKASTSFSRKFPGNWWFTVVSGGIWWFHRICSVVFQVCFLCFLTFPDELWDEMGGPIRFNSRGREVCRIFGAAC